MTGLHWALRPRHADRGIAGYDATAVWSVIAAARQRRSLSILTLAALLVGIALLALGLAVGVVGIGAGLLLLGFLDRRLSVLGVLVAMPGLGAFNGIVLADVDGHALDVRLILTGIVVAVLWVWIIRDRPRVGIVARTFAFFVVCVILLGALNHVAPLLALPVIARSLAYLGVFIASEAWMGSRRGAHAVMIAAVIGLLAPALSGLVQLVTGGGHVAADLSRLAGLYGSSPVGLALAMQIGVMIMAGGALLEGIGRNVRWFAGIATLALMAFLMAQTSTRLPFLVTAGTLVVFEILRRRAVGMVIVVVAAGVLLLSSSGLVDRLGSTFYPVSSPPPNPSYSQLPPGSSGLHTLTSQPSSSSFLASNEPGADTNEDRGGGAASLRFRLFLWRSMIAKWESSPIVGYGTGSFATLFQEETGLKRIAPHSDYIYILVEGGLLLLVAYLLVQGLAIAILLGRMLRGADARLPFVALAVLVATNVINNISNALLYVDLQLIVWAILAAVLAAGRVVANDKEGGGRLLERAR